MRKLLTAWIICCFALCAQARLGETPKEAEARYDKPIGLFTPKKPSETGALYEKAGIYIEVEFMKGRASHLTFKKKDGSELSWDEMEALLAASAGNSKWIFCTTDGPDRRCWKREDSTASAFEYRSPGYFSFSISTREWTKGLRERQDQEDAEKRKTELPGF